MIKAVDSVTLVRVNDGAKGNPTGVTASSTEPSSKYTGMLWKCTGNISGKIQNATYRWNGSSWELYVFKAANIDVNDLFAQNITAKHMTIEGDSTFSGELKAASGTFAGEMKADSISITSTGGNRNSSFEMNKNGMDIISNVTTATSTDGDYFTQSEINAADGVLEFGVSDKFNNKSSGTVSTLGSGKVKMSSSELNVDLDTVKINGTDWNDFVSRDSGFDWSNFNTENKTDTWVPVASGKTINHRYIPADAFTLSNSGYWYKYGPWTFARFDNAKISSIDKCPYPPKSTYYQYVVLYNISAKSFWHGWLQILTDGTVKGVTITSLGATGLYWCDANNFSVYGNVLFFNC